MQVVHRTAASRALSYCLGRGILDAYGGGDDPDEWSPVRAPRQTREATQEGSRPASVLGWAALVASLVAAFLTLAAITPLALPTLPHLGPDIIYALALVGFWPFVLLGVALDVVAGWRGGDNRRMALAGGIVMAIAGAYALSALAVIVAEMHRAAGT
jgi:hypothetical protein